MYDLTRAESFLRAVWGAQRSTAGAYLCAKETDGSWHNQAVWAGGGLHERSMVLAARFLHTHAVKRSDLYFSPNTFEPSRPRSPEYVCPGRMLYADLDEVDPRDLEIGPTLMWESSPGRFQALWLLDRVLPPHVLSKLGRALVYAVDADRDSWALNKVLRIPGTVNHKYPKRPTVTLLPSTKQVHDAHALLAAVKQTRRMAPGEPSDAPMPRLPNTTAAHLRKRYRKRLSRRARKLLAVRTLVGKEDRSARLWELELSCLDAGMKPTEVLIVVRACAFNKFAGRAGEQQRLWKDIQRAIKYKERRDEEEKRAQRGGSIPTTSEASSRESLESSRRLSERRSQNAEPDDDGIESDKEPQADLTPVRLSRYLARHVQPPSWLVSQIWGRAAHGIWAGDFKSYKSTLLMDLAVSVASGRPFLGSFVVQRTGPVLYIQEENSHGFMHDRLHRMMQAKGLGNAVTPNGSRTSLIEFGHDLDLHLLNLTGFQLTRTDHLASLAEWCAMHNPALVILDPLYRLAPGVDENSQSEMAPILNPLADISNTHDCALVLAHHYNKPNAGNQGQRAGHRISGTSVFSRWWESSVYAQRAGEPSEYRIQFHTEHREHGSAAAQSATVEMSPDDPDMYNIHLAEVLADDDAKVVQEETDGNLNLDNRTTRVAVMTVRSQLGLTHSRDAQKVLKAKGYTIRKPNGKGKLYAYPPER